MEVAIERHGILARAGLSFKTMWLPTAKAAPRVASLNEFTSGGHLILPITVGALITNRIEAHLRNWN
jgi:hypothetical protein